MAGNAIAVGVDGSESALGALRWAAREAEAHHVPLRLLHAAPQFAQSPGTGREPKAYFDVLAEEGHEALRIAEAELAANHPNLTVHSELIEGFVLPALVKESESARLFVVGSRGLGGFTGLLVGSTAVGLAQRGHCPVAIIRPNETEVDPAAPVVVGIDGSPASEEAVGVAFAAASAHDAPLRAVHTWTPLGVGGLTYPAAAQMFDWAAIETEEQAVLAERLAGWQERYPDVVVERVVVQDRPVRYLAEASKTARLLVVGSRGFGEFKGILVGSTSQALIYHGTCPLIVARPQPAR